MISLCHKRNAVACEVKEFVNNICRQIHSLYVNKVLKFETFNDFRPHVGFAIFHPFLFIGVIVNLNIRCRVHVKSFNSSIASFVKRLVSINFKLKQFVLKFLFADVSQIEICQQDVDKSKSNCDRSEDLVCRHKLAGNVSGLCVRGGIH